MPGHCVLQCQFNFFGEDYRHRFLLQDCERTVFGQAVGSQLFALQRIDFVAEGDEADFAAGGDEGEGQAGFVFRAHGVTRRRAGRG